MVTKPPPTTVLLDIIKYYIQVKYDSAQAVPFSGAPEVGTSLLPSLHHDQIIQ